MSEVDDVIMNTIGAAIGTAAYIISDKISERRSGK